MHVAQQQVTTAAVIRQVAVKNRNRPAAEYRIDLQGQGWEEEGEE